MYDHKIIDKKWQDFEENANLNLAPKDPKNKKYVLDMFPYPSGAGLHVGHPLGYIATDIISRFYRMNGHSVLHPMGWDAFGLPAENFAIKSGVHPQESTEQNISRFKTQLRSIGLSYDWSREINTSSANYYKWTQWMFLQFFKSGLAYKKEAMVNWCPKDQTVLANEQVLDGRCERCGTAVEQKMLSQWFFKITDYAEELISSLENLDWPESIKLMQKNWIGKSQGAKLKFYLKYSDSYIEVFTTRPDTLFGATYMVLSPEHPLVSQLTTPDQKRAVDDYLESAKKKTELERLSLEKDKTGVFTGAYCLNPATEKEIPVWVADYVLASYGTGAIMAVPAHDERDFAFAKKYDLPIKEVIRPTFGGNPHKDAPVIDESHPYLGEGTMINSGEYTGLTSAEGQKHITADFGKPKVQYRLRDWLISRQRYWGAPIPVIYCDSCGMQPVDEKDLPVLLPKDIDFMPTGESPLARSKQFHSVSCPKCQSPAKRDFDTMDTFVDSSWYFLRFADPNNNERFADEEAINNWLPIDLYQGGAEHAVLHLMYARFFIKALLDLKLLPAKAFALREPFIKLNNQGLILGPDGEKMSKSRGNVINPDEIIEEFGADAFRLYEMFMGPLNEAKPWNIQGIVGTRRFLEKVFRFQQNFSEGADSPDINALVKKITEDINSFKFNTSVAAFMEYLNLHQSFSKKDWEKYLILLSPFAPHLTQELWSMLGKEGSIFEQGWPSYDLEAIKGINVTVAVQISGKTRGTLSLPSGSDKESVRKAVLANPFLAKYLEGREVIKDVFVPDRLINFVIKE
jgi:leucyl-tRNA synthetase